MSQQEHLEQHLEALGRKLEPDAGFDKQVMMRVHATAPKVSPLSQLRRLIMDKPVRYLSPAIAAMVITAVFLGLRMMGVSPDGSTIAFADLISSMNRKWVYMYMDNAYNIAEFWINVQGGIEIRRYNGEVTYTDFNERKSYRYLPQKNTILVEYPYELARDMPNRDPDTTRKILNRPYAELQRYQRAIETLGLVASVRHGQYRGHEVQIQEYIRKDFSATKPWLTLYIDAQETVLRGYTQWVMTGTGPDPNQLRDLRIEKVEGAYDFPDPGPQSIYDIDVPRDAKVINRIDFNFIELWKSYREYRKQAPENLSDLAKKAWPKLMRDCTIIEDEYSKAKQLICIERLQKQEYASMQVGSGRFLYYLDPAKNYICQKEVVIWDATPKRAASMSCHETTKYHVINDQWYPATIETWLTDDLEKEPLKLRRIEHVGLDGRKTVKRPAPPKS